MFSNCLSVTKTDSAVDRAFVTPKREAYSTWLVFLLMLIMSETRFYMLLWDMQFMQCATERRGWVDKAVALCSTDPGLNRYSGYYDLVVS